MAQGQLGGPKALLTELDVLVGRFNTYSPPAELESVAITSYHQPAVLQRRFFLVRSHE